MLELVAENGYAGVSVTAIVKRARVSSKTFYEHFDDCEDCFLATFEQCLSDLKGAVAPAYNREGRWADRVRRALWALLARLDNEPATATLVFLEAPRAGAAVRERRARVTEILRVIIDAGRLEATSSCAPPELTNEVVVEGAIAAIQRRLAHPEPASLTSLVDPLMSVITHSYLGTTAPAEKPGPAAVDGTANAAQHAPSTNGLLASIPMRITYRTLGVLTAISQNPGATNRSVGDAAGISDAGQISRLLSRLESVALIRNGSDRTSWAPNGWHLTPLGEQVEHTVRHETR